MAVFHVNIFTKWRVDLSAGKESSWRNVSVNHQSKNINNILDNNVKEDEVNATSDYFKILVLMEK